MIRLDGELQRLTNGERYGLSVLIDLSRLPLVESAAVDIVRLEISDDRGGDWTLVEWVRDGFGIRVGDGAISISRQALRCATALAGGEAEQRTEATDKHGRVPSAENPLVGAGLERDPVVSRAGVALRTAAISAAGRRPVRLLAAWPDGHRWAAAITHDLDVVAWWPLFTLQRVLELARKGDARRAMRVVVAAMKSFTDDPVQRGTDAILKFEHAHSLPSTWFVLAALPTLRTLASGDVSYRLEAPAADRILGGIAAAGNEIGLHGSFATMESPERFSEQRTRLHTQSGQMIAGVRQHFLRMRPGRTHRAMEAAGFTYDASYGFPDRSGFRLGVADVVPGWDAAKQGAARLDEVPLVWMDRSFSKYRQQEDARDWVDDALELAQTVRAVDGLWVGLWHPNMTAALGFSGTEGALESLLLGLLEEQPFVGTLGDIVSWRAARRHARITQLAPDGRVVLTAAPSSVGTPTLLDAGAT